MSDEMRSRINLEEFLLSESERVSMDPPIYKGFSFLVDVLVESGSWERGPVPGQISFEYVPHSDQLNDYISYEIYEPGAVTTALEPSISPVKVILDLRSTLGKNPSPGTTIHLEVIVHSKSTGRSTNACIASRWHSEDMPITDVCASFILWALSGFLSPPHSLISAIIQVCDSDAYDRFRERRLDILQNRRNLRLRAELLRQNEIERRRNFENTLALNIFRMDRMTWAELAEEHHHAGLPNSRLEEELHRYRENLLFPNYDSSEN